MTHLQILRGLLQAGYSVKMEKLADGYHIEITKDGGSDAPAKWEIMDARLDQAVIRLSRFLSKDVKSFQE